MLFRNETRDIDLTCEGGTAFGAITTGPGQAGSGIAQVSDMRWQECVGLTLVWDFTPRDLPWGVDISSEVDGVVTGEITGVRIVQADVHTGGSQCYFELIGTLPFTYTNATQLLEMSGTSLTMGDVSGSFCPLVMDNGDGASFDMTYRVDADNPAENPIAISQD